MTDNTTQTRWLLFLIWPLIALIYAIAQNKKRWAKNVFLAFFVFYGMTFTVELETSSADIVSYVSEIQVLHGQSFTFQESIQYYRDYSKLDPVRPFLAILISRFTANQKAVTAIFSLIMGFFLSRNLFLLFSALKGKLKPITQLLVLCFFLSLPFWQVGGYRMWTAMHMFLYGFLMYLAKGQKKYLLFSYFSWLFHYSFFLPIAVLTLFLTIGNKLWFYYVFFVVSILFSEIDIKVINYYMESYLPKEIVEPSEAYRIEKEDSPSGSSRSWHAVYYLKAMWWTLMGYLLLLVPRYRIILAENKYLLSLICFALLMFALTNYATNVGAGGRFYRLSALLTLFPLAILYQNFNRTVMIGRLFNLSLPFVLLFIVVSIRTSLYTFSVSTIFSNPLLALFLQDDIKLDSILKAIF